MAHYRDVTRALTEALDSADDDDRNKLHDVLAAYRAVYGHKRYPPLIISIFDAIEASVNTDK
jgi:RNA:NAD 2'-phosphotransferase (TPT1/KptA family)